MGYLSSKHFTNRMAFEDRFKIRQQFPGEEWKNVACNYKVEPN